MLKAEKEAVEAAEAGLNSEAESDLHDWVSSTHKGVIYLSEEPLREKVFT